MSSIDPVPPQQEGKGASRWRASEVDLYVWQMQVLDDLTKFVEAHGPSKRQPLPVLSWMVGTTRSVSARLVSGLDYDPVSVLRAYAAVLGVKVIERREETQTNYRVKGAFGRREGTAQEPRCRMVITMTVYHSAQEILSHSAGARS
ncbi:MAG TPA: hypothetical protein VGS97_26025 [Actinocrinis sp.]|nr:hypothetical protein [Actinocrinis sp.]